MTKKALGAIVSKVCVLFNDLGFFCFFFFVIQRQTQDNIIIPYNIFFLPLFLPYTYLNIFIPNWDAQTKDKDIQSIYC